MADPTVGVIGVGAVGARAARQLVSTDDLGTVVLRDVDVERVEAVARSLGSSARVETPPFAEPPRVDVAVLATPAGTHADLARDLLGAGSSVVSVADSVEDVRALLDLDAEARERGLSVVVGAGFSPGLTCVLARHAAAAFTAVDEIHVAVTGTGGPECARQHHRALAGWSVDWRDGGWVTRRGGSGRELCFFPDPVGGQDCYRAARPEALLLAPVFPGVARVTARMAATRRDRLTARLPMLRKPHPEGGPGGVRVEVRGRQGTARHVRVLGAMDRPAVGAGAVAAVAAAHVLAGSVQRPGAGSLAELVEPVPFLTELARRGVKAAVFEGHDTDPSGFVRPAG
ncbi:Gfo/Idh/MocA family oxidoreductase [Actinomarinicola tropica]|uniref:Gfo/Idh/MocA family oxidoreductase n=1 Tax=Actinomarinicola tropica TaxID=2789776 RepID=UPI00189782DA|nr:Gfo/Idh/MocA family oxidoreductase [Actinomarinicola tropica]